MSCFKLLQDQNRVQFGSEALLGLALNQALAGRGDQARLEVDRIVKTGQLGDGADEMLAFAALTR